LASFVFSLFFSIHFVLLPLSGVGSSLFLCSSEKEEEEEEEEERRKERRLSLFDCDFY